ncbi:TIM21-domain-containing protein [Scheffersomyces xylosifermentans]|uniref:TIM21-domain-containing protein n=1 Tax=Scheffersomyces xylosifermentans TaxID=1304137 RepID=UPI00315D41D9
MYPAQLYVGLGVKSAGQAVVKSRILASIPLLAKRSFTVAHRSQVTNGLTKKQQNCGLLASNSGSSITTQLLLQKPFILASLKAGRLYSTTTESSSAPPPPPQHDKNAKGKKILNKATRAFTFSLSSVIVLAAAGVALLVVYLILSELFLPSGDTRTFNKAVKLVEKNELAQKLLEFKAGDRLKAYGEVASDRWVRNRPVHSVRTKGQDGKDHHLMKFHVESDNGKHATVTLEQVDNSFWSSDFAYIALDKAGAKRIYIVEPKFNHKNYVPQLRDNNGFLGLKWGPKKDN